MISANLLSYFNLSIYANLSYTWSLSLLMAADIYAFLF
jgi:hypothetical protein